MGDIKTSFVNTDMFTKVRESMLRHVNDSTGIKAVELVTVTTVQLVNVEAPDYIEGDKSLKPDCLLGDAIHEVLEDLIRSGDIVELEYVLANSDYKARSMFFPKGTEFTLPGK